MAKLVDTTEWREFRVGDLFDVCRGTGYGLRGLADGDTPLISAKTTDNSIVARANVPAKFPLNTITVTTDGAGMGFATVQIESFDIASNAVALLPRGHMDIAQAALLFMCPLISQGAYRFNYGDKFNANRVRELILKLPATSDGKPDWSYMEQYMAHVMDEMRPVAEELHQLESTLSLHAVDVSEWKEFHLYDDGMFDITMGNKFDKIRMTEGDDCNFVGRSGADNGVACRVTFVDGVEPYAAGCLTLALGGSIGSCFMQTDAFYTSQNVAVLEPKQKVERSALEFAATAIMKVAQTKYTAFQNELNRHVRTDFVCKLPATPDGKPDWDAMAEMMRGYTDSVRDVAHVIAELGR